MFPSIRSCSVGLKNMVVMYCKTSAHRPWSFAPFSESLKAQVGALDLASDASEPNAIANFESALTFFLYRVVVPTPNVPFLIALAVKWFNTTWFGTANILLSSNPAGLIMPMPVLSDRRFGSGLTITRSRMRGSAGG